MEARPFPGLAATPIIDVMVGVRSLDAARQFFDVLDQNGLPLPSAPCVDALVLQALAGATDASLHLVEPHQPQFAARIAFRDYLRTHPDAADAYGALKIGLAKR